MLTPSVGENRKVQGYLQSINLAKTVELHHVMCVYDTGKHAGVNTCLLLDKPDICACFIAQSQVIQPCVSH